MAYHMLFTKDEGKWNPQFGDYDRKVVIDEARDSYSHYKVKDKHIAKLSTAHQHHVNEYQKKLNSISEAKVEKSLLAQWPHAQGEANFAAKHRWVSPNDKFLLPDNGVFNIMTQIFNRGANRYGYDELKSIRKMDAKVPAFRRGIDESQETEVRRKPRKDWRKHNIDSYVRKHYLRIAKILGLDKGLDTYSKVGKGIAFESLTEHLSADATIKDYIDDFQSSKNSKFSGKSPEKRRKMAIAAWYAKHESIQEGQVHHLISDRRWIDKVSAKKARELSIENRKKINLLDFAKRMGYKIPKPRTVGESEISEVSKELVKNYLKSTFNDSDKHFKGRLTGYKKLGLALSKPKVMAKECLGDYSSTPPETDNDEGDKAKHSFELLKSKVGKSFKTYNGGTVTGEKSSHEFNTSSSEVNSHNARKQGEDQAIPEGFYDNGIRTSPRSYTAGKAKKVSTYLQKQKSQIGKDMKVGR